MYHPLHSRYPDRIAVRGAIEEARADLARAEARLAMANRGNPDRRSAVMSAEIGRLASRVAHYRGLVGGLHEALAAFDEPEPAEEAGPTFAPGDRVVGGPSLNHLEATVVAVDGDRVTIDFGGPIGECTVPVRDLRKLEG